MTILRYVIIVFCLVPIIAILFVWYSTEIFADGSAFYNSFVWSATGVVLSYYSLLFSLFVALEVVYLSNKFFFKLRSPDIRKKLLSVSRNMSSFASEPAIDLRSQRFLAEGIVALRAAKRVKNKDVKRVATNAEKALIGLKTVSNLPVQEVATAGELDGYWQLHQYMTELADEVSSQIEDVRAMQ